ncbi:hypothetical protein ACWS7L_12750 [Exiguobacterium artemiae]|uniref:hypothetical protein n=1 Tax=Exiguobacterium sp. S22-S28 TaxID=3342768 RepID=UPI00372D0BE4
MKFPKWLLYLGAIPTFVFTFYAITSPSFRTEVADLFPISALVLAVILTLFVAYWTLFFLFVNGLRRHLDLIVLFSLLLLCFILTSLFATLDYFIA